MTTRGFIILVLLCSSVKSFPAQNSQPAFTNKNSRHLWKLRDRQRPSQGCKWTSFLLRFFLSGPLTRSPQTSATWVVSSVSYATLFKRKTKKKKESGRRALRKKIKWNRELNSSSSSPQFSVKLACLVSRSTPVHARLNTLQHVPLSFSLAVFFFFHWKMKEENE